jgi:hypothetical protein
MIMLTTIMVVGFVAAMALPGLITILLAGRAEEVSPPSPLGHRMQPGH